MSARPWERPTQWKMVTDHLAKAIAQGLRDGAPLHVIRSAMLHCHKHMTWDQDFPAVPPVLPDQLRIVAPPGTQQMLPLDDDDPAKTESMLAAGWQTWSQGEAS